MFIKETDIQKFAEAKVKELRQEIKKWESVLEAFGSPSNGHNDAQLSFLTPPAPTIKRREHKRKKTTIRQKAVDILKEANVPLTSREIMEGINRLYPDKIYNMTSFSGAFSGMYRKAKSGVKQYLLKEATLDIKALYGLSEWFQPSGEFKEEYQKKVLERYGVI